MTPRPPVQGFPQPEANTGDYFFAPPSPRTSRQTQGRTRGPIDLSIGPVENYKGAPPTRNPHDETSEIQVTGAQLGGDWERELHAWWVEHRRYPQQAIEQNEQGTVVIRFKVNRIGQTSGAEIISRSGSQWLDMQAIATFGHARLPPFPTNTPENEATLTLTINFQLIH